MADVKIGNTLAIIDGNYYAYRYFYRMPRLTGAQGQAMGATFAYAQLIQQLRAHADISHWVLVFDHPQTTFRHQLYPHYKEHRQPMPEDLKSQLSDIRVLAQAHGLPILSDPGFEADDTIAGLAIKAAEDGFHVRLLTKDKDLDQILSQKINTWDPDTDLLRGPDEVLHERGVPCNLMVDYLCMVGDSTDNVPGIRSIGPKNACKLLCQYGSLDKLLTHIDDFSGKRREYLKDYVTRHELTKQLITIKPVPQTIPPAELSMPIGSDESLRDQYRKIGLPISRFFRRAQQQASNGADYNYYTPGQIESTLTELGSRAALIIHPHQHGHLLACAGQAVSQRHRPATLIQLPLNNLEDQETLAQWCNNPQIKKIIADPQHSLSYLRLYKLNLRGINGDPFVAHNLLKQSSNTNSVTLPFLITHYLQEQSCAEDSDGAELCGEQAQSMWRLSIHLEQQLREHQLLDYYYRIAVPWCHWLSDRPQAKPQLDVTALTKSQQQQQDYLQALNQELKLKPFHNCSEQLEHLAQQHKIVLPWPAVTLARQPQASRGYHSLLDQWLQQQSLSHNLSQSKEWVPAPNDSCYCYTESSQSRLPIWQGLGSQSTTTPLPDLNQYNHCISAAPQHRFVHLHCDHWPLLFWAEQSQDPILLQACTHPHPWTALSAALLTKPLAAVRPQESFHCKRLVLACLQGQELDYILVNPHPDPPWQHAIRRKLTVGLDLLEQMVAKAKQAGYAQTILRRRKFIALLNSGQSFDQQQGRRQALHHIFFGSLFDQIATLSLSILSLSDHQVFPYILSNEHILYHIPEHLTDSCVHLLTSDEDTPWLTQSRPQIRVCCTNSWQS